MAKWKLKDKAGTLLLIVKELVSLDDECRESVNKKYRVMIAMACFIIGILAIFFVAGAIEANGICWDLLPWSVLAVAAFALTFRIGGRAITGDDE